MSKENQKKKKQNYRKTKDAFYWYITTLFSLLFFFITSLCLLFDAEKILQFDRSVINSLLGVAFTLTVTALFDLFVNTKNHNDNENIDTEHISKIFGVFMVIFNIVMFTILSTVEKLDYIVAIKTISVFLAISAFFYGYNVRKILYMKGVKKDE